MADQPEKRGLELLIRKSGSQEGIEIRRVRADKAFLKLRPRRSTRVHIEERALESALGEEYMLRNVDADRYLRLNAREYYLWEHIDGAHTIQDLAVAYFQAYGSFEFEEIRGFLNKARRLGAVQVRPTTVVRARQVAQRTGLVGALGRALTYDRSWQNVDRWFTRAHRMLGWLFSKWMLPVHAALIALGLYAYFEGRFTHRFGAGEHSALAWWGLFVLTLPGAIALHEIAHGMATKACGRRVKAVGISVLDYLLPSVYVDVTDMFMSTRWRRIGVSLAGPGVNLVTAAVAVGLARWLVDPTAGFVWLVIADACYFLAAVTLWPFHGFREDGYDALTDLVKVTALREHAWQLVTWFLPFMDEEKPARPWWPPVLYATLVLASWGGALALLLT